MFISKLTKDGSKIEWIKSKHGIAQVLELADGAKRRYEAKADSKAFEWLSKFSSRLQYYGTIMDTVRERLWNFWLDQSFDLWESYHNIIQSTCLWCGGL
jgi:hypothetical protein